MKRKEVAKCLLSAFLTISLSGILGNTSQVKAESYKDPAPYINPINPNGKSILFDNTHGQTAGAADWVIDGGFSDYAEGLAEEGFYVKELRKNGAITYDDLKEYNTFIIPEANIPFKVSEQEAIEHYVNEGGSVFFIADHYNADRNKNRWDSSEVFNGYRRGAYENPVKGMTEEEKNSNFMEEVKSSDWLADTFGVRFRYNALGDITANQIVSSSESFGITEGIESIAMHAGSTIAILDPTVAKGVVYLPDGLDSSDKWPSSVDQGVYDGGGVEEGAYVAIAKKGAGKAAFIGDSSPVEDATPKYKKEEGGQAKKTYDGYKEQDDATLLLQLTEWLSTQESYSDFTETGITLDEATELQDFEDPASSTEPQKEPWTEPQAGYKWYDTSTFAVGSYGYENSGEVSPPADDKQYNFHMPNEIIVGEELPLTIRLSGLQPNTTIENLKVGAYIDGGTQIGKFKEINGNWQDSYGYSEVFSVKTDENGNAVKTFVFKIKDNIVGPFNLRIKKGSLNVLTDTYEAVKESTGNLPPIGEAVYSIIKPSVIKNDTVMALTVRVRNLNPGDTISNLRIGAYLDGGTQIGKFTTDDSTWPKVNGYSDNITLTADKTGTISQTLLFKIDGTASGKANLRIKIGSSNAFTEIININE